MGFDPAGPDLPDDGRPETHNQRLDRNWTDILQELRVTQTGTQVVGGFLLALAFQPRFAELDPVQLAVYLVLVGLAALATLLGLGPVILHRLLFGRLAKDRVVRAGNRLLMTALVVVGLLTIGVVWLVFDFTIGRLASSIALAVGLLLLAGLWTTGPRLGRRIG